MLRPQPSFKGLCHFVSLPLAISCLSIKCRCMGPSTLCQAGCKLAVGKAFIVQQQQGVQVSRGKGASL